LNGRRALPTLLGPLIVALLLAGSAYAQPTTRSAVLFNKSFTPNIVQLGGTSTVTVTFTNSNTASSSTITSFEDDIATMAGHAAIASPSALATTCAGGTPTISGTVVSMNDGVIPMAPSATVLGTCTITFNVIGTAIGNGFNTIYAANFSTSLGVEGTQDVTQTLTVESANLTVAAGASIRILVGQTGTETLTINNPTAVPLTNVSVPIAYNNATSFTINTATTNCGATVSIPAQPSTTGTLQVSGGTIPAGGSCVITLTATSAVVATANFTIATGSVINDQGVTNPTAGASNQIIWAIGNPNVAKSFSPSGVAPGQTTTLTITVQNVFSVETITNGAFTDTLPASLTIAAGSVTFTNCTGSAAGTTALEITGLTIAPATTCTIHATVDIPSTQPGGGVTNTLANTAFTSDQVDSFAQSASASLTVSAGAGGGFTATKAVSPTSAGVNTPITVTLTFTAFGGGTFTNGTFVDNLPQTPAPMAAVTSTPPTFTGCGAAPSVTFSSGNTVVTGSNLEIPTANGSCVVHFTIAFTTPVSVPTNVTNGIPSPGISFTDALSNVVTAGTGNVTITEQPSYSVQNYTASASGLVGQPLTVTATLLNTAEVTDTNAVVTINLNPGSVALAPDPNFVFGPTCPPGLNDNSVDILNGGSQFTVSIPEITGAPCTITYNVIDVGGATGTFTPGSSNYRSDLTGGSGSAGVTTTGTNNVTFLTSSLNVTKSFSPSTIQAGSTATASVSVGVKQAGTLASTQANGVAYSDSLPTDTVFATNPNVTFTNCQISGQPAPSYVINGTEISFSNLSMLTTGSTITNCVVTFDVTSYLNGSRVNTIPASSITSTSGVTNPAAAVATLTVGTGLGISKTFLATQLHVGDDTYMRLLITNTTGINPIAAAQVTDTMPSQLSLASTALGPAQPGDPPACGGALVGTVGSSSFQITGMTLPGALSASPPATTCVEYVLVQANTTATPGTYTNTIPAEGLTGGGFGNLTPASASIDIVTAQNVDVFKTFDPTTISPNGTSELTITIANDQTGSSNLSNIALEDDLPTGVTLAYVPNPRTTCTSGSVAATSLGTTIKLTGASLAAGAECTITVVVRASNPGSYVDTIPQDSLTSLQGATNSALAQATLNVVQPANVNITKAFSPEQIFPGGSSTATITIANTAPGAAALSHMGLTDTLPSGITVFSTPGASTTCPGGTVTAVAGATTVTLAGTTFTGATLAAGASCTITFNVTGTAIGTYTNIIPNGSISTLQGATNDDPAEAQLAINTTPALNITKSFSPVEIAPGGTSVLTFTIANTDTGAVGLTGMGASDTLPTGITIATTPGASTTCTGGTVTAPAGGSTVGIDGASLAAGATCTVTVNVTGTALGTYVNTIPAHNIVNTQGVSNPVAVTATLLITTPSLSVAKTSNPQGSEVTRGQTIAYSIAVTNNGTGTETNAFVHDVLGNATLVSGSVMVNGASAPDAVITSGQSFGSIAPGATTTITYNATVNQTAPAGSQVTDTATAGGTQPCTGTGCTASSTPNTVASPSITISKQIDEQQQINALPGQTVTYTILVTNTALGEAQHVVITDPVPTGITPIPGSVKINGTVAPSATISGQTVTIPIGTLASGTSATITFNATVGMHVTTGTLTNVATVSSSDLSESPQSNEAVAQLHPPTLVVTKTASATVAQVGDRVNYSITVQPLNNVAYGTTTIVDTLPDYVIYAPGTARVNGVHLEPKVSGHVLTWELPSLGASATITYATAISAGAQPNASLTNIVNVRAEGPGGSEGTGEASATVLVVASNLGSCYPITGRVYLDQAGTGHFQGSDPGLSGVRIYLDTGEYVITDQHGLYNFPCVRPGMHALRLDATTLPAGATPYDDHNIDSEKSTRRLVHGIFDTTIIKDINFAIKPGAKPQ
jgi:uncharacterized repeat protein (TIGR01451 family)